jgi:hypothetical protein
MGVLKGIVIERTEDMKSTRDEIEEYEYQQSIAKNGALATVADESVDDTLARRATKYGAYKDISRVTEYLYEALRKEASWDDMPDPHKVSLFFICNKLARIVVGDANYTDNWHDIAGYASLVERELKNNGI